MQRTWAEICCFGCSCLQLFWPRVVLRKWLNISAKESDYSADTEDDEDVNSSDSETEGDASKPLKLIVYFRVIGFLKSTFSLNVKVAKMQCIFGLVVFVLGVTISLNLHEFDTIHCAILGMPHVLI